ncbi:MAG TPA: hypothetical protein VK619_14750 [Pyrinomonadaceae bacterium]|nr:hypothetical protein [Pyrinomonadaceae bacterium]
MMINSRTEKPFTFEFINEGSKVLLGLTNGCDQTLKCIEVLTVFLKDEETPGGGPSQANIKFKDTECIYPNEKIVLSHRTWINGKPADPSQDQLERLKVIAGEVKPYVLDISWEDADGKSRFQRIPVGH